MRSLRRRDCPGKRASEKNTARRVGAIAGLGLAAALTAYLLTPCDIGEKARHDPEAAPSNDTSQRRLKRAQEMDEVRRFIARANKEAGSGLDLLGRLRKEFPYGILDCQMVSIDPSVIPEKPGDRQPDHASDNTVVDSLGKIANALEELQGFTTSVISLHELIVRKGGCKADFTKPLKACPTGISRKVEELNEKKDIVGLARAVKFLDSLNLEWMNAGDMSSYDSLAGVYTGMYLDAAAGGANTSPDPGCLASNYYAIKLLHTARFHIAKLLSEDPGLASDLLHTLPKHQRENIFRLCSLFLDTRSLRDFYHGLPHEARGEFLGSSHGMASIIMSNMHPDAFPEDMASAMRYLINADAFTEELRRFEEELLNGGQEDQ